MIAFIQINLFILLCFELVLSQKNQQLMLYVFLLPCIIGMWTHSRMISIHLEWFSRVFVWTVYASVLCAEGSHLHNCTYIYSTRKPIRSMRRTGQSWHGGKWRSGQSTSWPVCSRDTAALATSLKTTTRFQSGTSRHSQVSYCPHLLFNCGRH